MDFKNIVQDELGNLVELYKHLHANPELSCNEKSTSATIADQLEKCDIDVTRGLGGYGIVGVLRNGDGPTLMLRADMDALPIMEDSGVMYASKVKAKDSSGNNVGVMHACGHDVHMTSLVGAAKVLSKIKDSWNGTILFVRPTCRRIHVRCQRDDQGWTF